PFFFVFIDRRVGIVPFGACPLLAVFLFFVFLRVTHQDRLSKHEALETLARPPLVESRPGGHDPLRPGSGSKGRR
ncbi:MAG: hypothetical protein KDD44_01170, partial [Bdellovibrionales bacterium]|nr:hypothetical protein [Bdellovibrionales bacterium]